MKYEVIKSDITVVGGGLAGVNAAISAARLGKSVSLIQNRPVLGGNSSSEVRVWVVGATAHFTNRYARETGIMGEMFVENQYINPDGNPYFWDLTVLEMVLAEKNITLFLNTDVHEVEADGNESNRTIHSVTGWMMGSERRIRFESQVYLDCTGDGLVGFLAGARYRIGREAQHEYNEEWAPEVADDITLGSTILFYTKDVGHPVKYVAPSFAKDITETSIPLKRVIRSGDSGCHYWWIEWGGELDTVYDNERIRDELWSVIYGIWDYIKNSGKFEAENMTLEWVGSIPGKREYRRFVGDYVLDQNDIMAQRPFADRVAFGGWGIDLHPPEGMYANTSGSKHSHADGIYHIPFRSLYSVNVDNLLFAGRDISATHIAFGTTRVMATCAVMGEAAGAAAALCVEKSVTPRGLYNEHIDEFQQQLLRQDAALIGLANEDSLDHARTATVTSSSQLQQIKIEKADEAYDVLTDIGMIVPVDPKIEQIEFLLDALEDTVLEVELWETGKKENYVPHTCIVQASVKVAKGQKQWISTELEWTPDEPQNAFIIVRANPLVQLYLSHEPLMGMLAFETGAKKRVSSDLEDHDQNQSVIKWSMKKLGRKNYCVQIHPNTNAFAPAKVIDGYNRPYGGPHIWLSERMQDVGNQQATTGESHVVSQAEWLQCTWGKSIDMREIHLTFNDDVNEDLINLHHHRTPFDVMPGLVRNYRLEAWIDGKWEGILEVKDNRKRKRIHSLPESVRSDKLRIVVEETNGSPYAEIIEVRVYS